MSTDAVVAQNDIIIISDDEEQQQCEVVEQNDGADCFIVDGVQLSSGGGGSMPRTDSPPQSTSAEYVGGCKCDNRFFLSLYYSKIISCKFINLLILCYFLLSCEEPF